jgi:hypothetical protein
MRSRYPSRLYDEDDDDPDDRPARPRRRRKPKRSGDPTVRIVLIVVLSALVVGGCSYLAYLLISRGEVGLGGPRARDRFIGAWETDPPERPGSKLVVEFRGDGRLTVTASEPGRNASKTMPYEVLSEQGNRATIRHRQDPGTATDWQIDLLPGEQIRVRNLTHPQAPDRVYSRRR